MQITTRSTPCRPFIVVLAVLVFLAIFTAMMTADHRAEAREKKREAKATAAHKAEEAKKVAAREKAIRQTMASVGNAVADAAGVEARKKPSTFAKLKSKLAHN